MTFILIKPDSISCSSVYPITTRSALKALAFPVQDIQQAVATRNLRWILNSSWAARDQSFKQKYYKWSGWWRYLPVLIPCDQIHSVNSGFRKSPHGWAEGWRTESIFHDFSTHTSDLYKWSFVRLHSSARLKAATILCKPLKAQESKCASRPNQDHDLVINHKPHF